MVVPMRTSTASQPFCWWCTNRERHLDQRLTEKLFLAAPPDVHHAYRTRCSLVEVPLTDTLASSASEVIRHREASLPSLEKHHRIGRRIGVG
jgi:hypothetical protein